MNRRNYEELAVGVSAEHNVRRDLQKTSQRIYMEQHRLGINEVTGKFHPWFGPYNNEPAYLMHLVTNNPIINGLVTTKCEILRGAELTLFDTSQKGKDGSFMPLTLLEMPDEIEDFYNYNELNELAYDMFYSQEVLGNFFVELIANTGSSKVTRKITDINYVYPETVRAVANKRKQVTAYGIADQWQSVVENSVITIPAFIHKQMYNSSMRVDPSKFPGGVLYHGKKRIPHFRVYSPPKWYGARTWMETQNLVPVFHANNLWNMFGLRMIASIDREIIDRLMAEVDEKTGERRYKSEKQILDKYSAQFSEFMTNPENAGKSMTVTHRTDQMGKITRQIHFDPIQHDMKDNAYAGLDKVMNQAVTSSEGVDPSLAGVWVGGSMGSGSEKRLAWNIEVSKGEHLRSMIAKVFNFVHQFNGWDTKYRWGFRDKVMVKADEEKTGVVETVPPITETEDV